MKENITKELLEELYCTQGLTPKHIYTILGVSKNTLYKKFKEFHIQPKTFQKTYDAKSICFTPQLHQLLIGSLLGDGHIAITSNTSARFEEPHSLKQLEYVKWKTNFFGALIKNIQFGEAKVNNKTYQTCKIKTLSHPRFKQYHDLFYANRKIITTNILSQLTPFSIAIWYMDDGSLHANNQRYRISTDCFTVEEHVLIQTYFQQSFNIKPNIFQDHRSGNFYLEFNHVESLKFDALIRSDIIPAMEYKLINI